MVAPSRAPLRTDRLRAVNEPQLVTVEIDEFGVPKAVKKRLRLSDGREENATVVESVLEMWRIDDEWWRQLISRRYFAVLLEGGGRVVLFEDLVTGEWFMQTA